MLNAIRGWVKDRFATSRTAAVSDRRASSRPNLETLEARDVPTVSAMTFHGGPLLQHVEVQGLYLGSDWQTNAQARQIAGQTEGFLNNLVHSSYMDMLTNAGYGVGRGSFTAGRVDGRALNKSVFLTDGQIQNVVQQDVTRGLATPDANRLYVVYVEPGVSISTSFGTSINSFQAYHSAFSGNDGHGHRININYAVIPFHTGRNAHDTRVSTFDSMTESASHEIAEAATDPIPGRGWVDNKTGNEIGDFTHNIVRLNGFVVQELAAKNTRNMIPKGATLIAGASNPSQAIFANAAPSNNLNALFSTQVTATPASLSPVATGLHAAPPKAASHVSDALFASIF